jgi:hypothetical protein
MKAAVVQRRSGGALVAAVNSVVMAMVAVAALQWEQWFL